MCLGGSRYAFLHGERQSIQLTGFDGIAAARFHEVRIDSKNIVPEQSMEKSGRFWLVNEAHSFSATIQALGRGNKAYLELIKTQDYNDKRSELRTMRQKEYETLQQWMEGSNSL